MNAINRLLGMINMMMGGLSDAQLESILLRLKDAKKEGNVEKVKIDLIRANGKQKTRVQEAIDIILNDPTQLG